MKTSLIALALISFKSFADTRAFGLQVEKDTIFYARTEDFSIFRALNKPKTKAKNEIRKQCEAAHGKKTCRDLKFEELNFRISQSSECGAAMELKKYCYYGEAELIGHLPEFPPVKNVLTKREVFPELSDCKAKDFFGGRHYRIDVIPHFRKHFVATRSPEILKATIYQLVRRGEERFYNLDGQDRKFDLHAHRYVGNDDRIHGSEWVTDSRGVAREDVYDGDSFVFLSFNESEFKAAGKTDAEHCADLQVEAEEKARAFKRSYGYTEDRTDLKTLRKLRDFHPANP